MIERKRFIEVSLMVFTPGLWAFYYRDSLNYPLTMRFLLPRMASILFHGGGTISRARRMNSARPDLQPSGYHRY